MAPLPYRDLRHPWLRYQVMGNTEDIRHDLDQRLRMVYTGGDGQQIFLGGVRRSMICRQFILVLGLHTEQEITQAGFAAYWFESERVIPHKGDLRDYWIEISSDRDFLGVTPSYVHIRDPVKEQGSCDYWPMSHIYNSTVYVQTCKGRKSGARLSGGYFIRRLVDHFGLVSDEGFMGLTVISRELLVIYLHELDKLNICGRFGDTWAWVAPGPEKQPVAAANALEAAKDAPVEDEGAQADPAPA
ncbi:hypothetical protein Tco_0411648 [Tanacetum coccineum]